jgi:hypothetical protein
MFYLLCRLGWRDGFSIFNTGLLNQHGNNSAISGRIVKKGDPMTNEQRKALTEYLGEPEATSEYTVANSGDLVSVRTVIQNRTFTTDADMMALFRKMVDKEDWYNFSDWARYGHTTFSQEDFDELSTWLFYEPERFCCLVAEWLKCRSGVSGEII